MGVQNFNFAPPMGDFLLQMLYFLDRKTSTSLILQTHKLESPKIDKNIFRQANFFFGGGEGVAPRPCHDANAYKTVGEGRKVDNHIMAETQLKSTQQSRRLARSIARRP